MHRYIIRRLLLAVPTLLLVSIAVFGMTRIIPGDAVVAIVGDTGNISPAQLAGLKARLGLDKPFHTQYFVWIRGVLTGDLGNSYYTRKPVVKQLMSSIPITLELAAIGLTLGMLFAIPLGIISAIRQDTISDYAARVLAVLGISMPNFWIATMVVVYLGLFFAYLPPLGYSRLWEEPGRNLQQFYLPGLVLGFQLSGTTARMVRSSMLEVLRQDYIRTALAKGLRERVVVTRHAVKNALIPVVTIIGNLMNGLIGGTVIIETIFALPGVGQLTIGAVTQRDYPQIQANIMFLATFLILMNLVIDLTYGWLDPRIRYS